MNEEDSFRVTSAQFIAESLSVLDWRITVRALPWEEYTAALAAEVQSSLSRQFSSPAIKRPDTVKRARCNLQQDRLACSKPA